MKRSQMLFAALSLACMGALAWAQSIGPQELTALKQGIPRHPSGPITEATDPRIRDLVAGYASSIRPMTLENYRQSIAQIKARALKDIEAMDGVIKTTSASSSATRSEHRVALQNKGWLESLVKYLDKFK